MPDLEEPQHTDVPKTVPRRRFRRVRAAAEKYKRLFVGSAAVAGLLAVALVAFVLTDEPERVPLGVGKAGVMMDTSTVAAAPEGDTTQAAPPDTPGGGEESGALGEGEASYYGDEFAGRPTASGERFNPEGMTAAHRTLPFGTRLRVTDVQSGRSVVVRVNDRGPFSGNRVLDLSESAARQIGLLQRGAARVRMVVLR